MKPRRCKEKAPGCEGEYLPRSSFQQTCGNIACAMKKAVRDRQKKLAAQRARTRAERLAIKSRGEWLKDAQQVFNKFIRLRDNGKPCISCNQNHGGQYHAGHYLSRGARPDLRFSERNTHKQCAPCNNHLSGNLANYRINLIEKIGEAAVVELESGPRGRSDWSILEIQEIIRTYKAKIKELQA